MTIKQLLEYVCGDKVEPAFIGVGTDAKSDRAHLVEIAYWKEGEEAIDDYFARPVSKARALKLTTEWEQYTRIPRDWLSNAEWSEDELIEAAAQRVKETNPNIIFGYACSFWMYKLLCDKLPTVTDRLIDLTALVAAAWHRWELPMMLADSPPDNSEEFQRRFKDLQSSLALASQECPRYSICTIAAHLGIEIDQNSTLAVERVEQLISIWQQVQQWPIMLIDPIPF